MCEFTDKVTKFTLKIGITIEDRVVKTKDTCLLHTAVIYESVDKGPNEFHIIRCQKRNLEKAVNNYKNSNPNAIVFHEITYNPNSINYYTRIKEVLKGKIKWRYNDFELVGITKKQLKEYVQKVDDEKYEIDNIQ